MRISFASAALALSLGAGLCAYAQNTGEGQNVTLSQKVKIPGASLKPGSYTFSIEDRLQDRAIVRITSQADNKHYLVLTVPSEKLPAAGGDGLVRFTTSNGKDEVLRGWACPGCSPNLEFVYPKAEAAKLTDETAEPVLAVDPTYDKLPANLSPDDMKVVTLWLLTPEQITASNKGKGVKAEKYASAKQAAPAETQTATANTTTAANNASEPAQVPATPAQPAPSAVSESSYSAQAAKPVTPVATPAGSAEANVQTSSAAPSPAMPASQSAAPIETASASMSPNRPAQSGDRGLPKTASNDYLYLFGGILLMLAGTGFELSLRFRFSQK